jgi:hypothetical protein
LVVFRRSRRWKKGMGEVVFSSGGWGRVDSTRRDNRLVRAQFTGELQLITCLRGPLRSVRSHVCERCREKRRGEEREKGSTRPVLLKREEEPK